MRKFVGTLGFVGHKGDIILGVAKDQDETVLSYYKRLYVTLKVGNPNRVTAN